MTLLKQVVSSQVTAINQVNGVVGYTTQRKEILFPININQNKKHYQILSYVVSFTNTNGTEFVIDFSKNDLSNLNVGDTISKIPFESSGVDLKNGSITVYMTSAYKFVRIPPINSWGAGRVDSVVSNVSANVNYGSLLPPIIQSNISNSFVDYRKGISINFSTKFQGNIFEQFTIERGVFKYREKGISEAYSEISFDGASVSIQKDTLVNGKVYECYATCIVDDNQMADSPLIELTTIDTIPVVKAKSPVNEITHGEVNFSWVYENATSTEQYAFDLQISKDGNDFTDLDTHVITSFTNISHIIEAGELYWRVRGYNQNDIHGEWSQTAKFINVAKPTKPIINEIQSSGRPLIKWSSDNQIAFELEIVGLFKTGQVYSVDKYYKFSEYIPNGIYNIKIRVYNKYDQFSDWAEFEYSQNMIVVLPNVKVQETRLGYNINIVKNPNHEKYYLLRNGIPIHKFTSDNFDDIYVNGNIKYTVRAVDFYDNFSDIDVHVSRKIEDEIVVINKLGEVFDLSLGIDDLCQVTLNTKKEYSKVMYLGKNKPSLYHGDDIAREWTINSNFDDLPIGELLFYRDYSGVNAWVMAYEYSAELQSWISRGSTVLIEVDYEEGIDYD